MIAIWMLRLLVATALVALAARAAEEAARGFGWPRRWVWAGAFLLVVVLPWTGALLPAFSLTDTLIDRLTPTASAGMPVLPADAAAVATTADPEAPRALFDVALLGAWMLASLTVALTFAHALRRVRIALRRGGAAGRVDGVAVIRCGALGPATFGALRPTIVLPRWVDELPAGERALIVSHEREHAAARDPSLLAAAAVIVAAAPWCLPLWWMHRRLRDAAETDCDARVLACGVDRMTYGHALLRAAGRPRTPALAFAAPLLGGLNVTRLERRIRIMTQQRPKRPVLRALPFIAVAAVASVVACDAAHDAVGAPIEGETDLETADQAEREREVVVHNALISAGSCSRSEGEGPREWWAAPGFCMVGSPQDSLRAAGSLRIVGDPVVYVDGEQVEDRAALTLDPAAIERIELVKDTAAAQYGPDPAARVIQIHTRNADVSPRSSSDAGSRRRRARELLARAVQIARREADTSSARSASGDLPPAAPSSASDRAELTELIVNPVERPKVELRRREDRALGLWAEQRDPVYYIDGERVSAAALQRLDRSMIQSVEVIKGAAAAPYGPGHGAGIVQIVTKNR